MSELQEIVASLERTIQTAGSIIGETEKPGTAVKLLNLMADLTKIADRLKRQIAPNLETVAAVEEKIPESTVSPHIRSHRPLLPIRSEVAPPPSGSARP